MEAAEAGQAGVLRRRTPCRAPRQELAPGLDGDLVETTIERFSKPTNFWRRYGAELETLRTCHDLQDSPATRIQLNRDGKSVDGIEVAGPDGSAEEVRGPRYVLALGGLETTRLLLASNDVRPDGIGNDSGHLGRNYMSHLCTTAGAITFSGPPDSRLRLCPDADGIYVRRRLWLTEKAQREFSLLNTTFRTHLPEPANPSHGDAILSAMFLVKDMVLYEYSRKFAENPVLGRAPAPCGNSSRSRFGSRGSASDWLRNRTFAERKLPSVVLGSRDNRYELEFHAEQAPNPDSRLTLSAERDALGMPRLKVDWRVTELDLESLKSSYALLAGELQNAAAPAGSTTIPRSWSLKRAANTASSAAIISAPRACRPTRATAWSIRLPGPWRRQPLCRQRGGFSDLRPGQSDAHPDCPDVAAGGASWQDRR